MKKCFLTFLALLVFVNTSLLGQQLSFNKDGKFKIVQFTDIHYVAGKEPSKSSVSMIEATLAAEKPDLVVFTGDIVVNTPTKQGWDEVLDLVINRNIPYLVTLGNHDDEKDMNRQQVAEYIATKKLLLNNKVTIEGVDGVLNDAITIQGKDKKPAAILYALDSHGYSKLPNVKGYDWFKQNQVNWYTQKSEQFKREHNATLPALAFFHIPLPEYTYAFDDVKNKRLGVRYEAECPPHINTGMYAAMLQAGDVLGTFVGHDHVNDYLVDYNGIALAYGCWSGSSNTYQRHKNGARIIELTEGHRGFTTYLREFDGQIVYKTDYPFPAKK